MAEISSRNTFFNQLKRILARVNDHPNDPLTLKVTDNLIKRAEDIQIKIENHHLSILGDCVDDEAVAVQDAVFENIMDVADRLAEKLINLRETLDTSQPRTQQQPQNHTIKLPELSLPSFDGKYEDWPPFEDLFRATIIDHPTLSLAQKLQYLKSCTFGEANKLIRTFNVTDVNFTEAWNLLETRYKNNREIIYSLIRKILSIPLCKSESISALQFLLNTTTECIRSLKVLKRPTDKWDDLLIVILVDKLDPDTRSEWAKSLTGTEPSKFTDLTAFLEKHIRSLIARGATAKPLAAPKPPHQHHSVKHTRSHHTSTSYSSSSMPSNCPICKGKHHPLYYCTQFMDMQPTQRKASLKKTGICLNCLYTGHRASDCPSTHKCKKCGELHHTLLHFDSTAIQQIPAAHHTQPRASSSSTVQSHHAATLNFPLARTLLKTAIVYVRDSRGERQPCRTFLDDGSEESFITEACAAALGLPRTRVDVAVCGIGEKVTARCKWVTTARLESAYGNMHIDINAYILKKVSGNMPASFLESATLAEWPHIHGLPLADPSYMKPGRVDILLGADVVAAITTGEVRRGQPHTPTAIHTIFGWTLIGSTSQRQACRPQSAVTTLPARTHHATTRIAHNSAYSSTTGDEPDHTIKSHNSPVSITFNTLESLVQRFWEIERVPMKRILTKEEAACEQHFTETHLRAADGRYQVRLPFNSTIHLTEKTFGASRMQAENRLHSLERRFRKHPLHHQAYIEFMDEYLDLGHMTPVPPKQDIAYYIPHHFVLKEDSTTTKLRVVFDASAITSKGVSLNTALMVGATLQDDLFSILLRFRMHPVALKADIAKMYRQFKMHPDDRNYQRILWRKHSNDPIQEYQLNTVTYGTAASSFLATRCLIQLARDEEANFPAAAAVLQRDTYVDDLISGASTTNAAKDLAQQLIAISKTGGMDMRKWISNSEEVINSIPPELREKDATCTFDEDAATKALGIVWLPSSDIFTFYTKTSPVVTTKRQLLSEISKTFDPLGWLSPVTICGKIFFQQLWQQGIGWDDKLSYEVQQHWMSMQQQLPSLSQLQIPRCIIPSNTTSIEIHGFSDASEKAYAACINLKCTLSTGEVSTNLLTAKTKVAPIQQTSLPRLELCAALLLTELLDTVTTSLGLQCNICCYTDSMIVLKWISSPSRRWKTYVANRVAAIQEVVPAENWKHVPSEENPADLGSRGVTVEQLISSHLWWNGPAWLNSPGNCYIFNSTYDENSQHCMQEVMTEERKIISCKHASMSTPFLAMWINSFSTLHKLVNATAIIRRFILYACKKQTNSGIITVRDRQQALHTIIRAHQGEEFTAEVKALTQQRQVSVSSKLSPLVPFIDEEGLIRVGGRLDRAQLPSYTCHPLILNKGPLAELITLAFHIDNLHSGLTLTLASIRQKYWILGARDFCRLIIRKCIVCRKANAALMQQQMGSLPAARITASRPFSHSGMDFAGPFNVKTRSGRGNKIEKYYFAVFVCMATKAVHLEYVSSLSTDAFIACFRRFCSRRGICSHLYSDCGTNFVGAEKELTAQRKKLEVQVEQQLVHIGTTFHFNPPAAPHQGGLWEACVKSVKQHMKRVVGASTLTIEQFITLLTNIEACLNSRPLCSLSSDPNDMDALTPGHFLVGGPLNAVPDPSLVTIPANRLGMWQEVQQLSQHFWARWKAEYITTLQQRQKWVRKHENIAVDDLVLIAEDNSAPSMWKLGRVAEVFPGGDGLVRKARVRYVANPKQSPVRYAEIIRPIQKLIEGHPAKPPNLERDACLKTQTVPNLTRLRPGPKPPAFGKFKSSGGGGSGTL